MEKNFLTIILIVLILVGPAAAVQAGENPAGAEFSAIADLSADGLPAVRILVKTGEQAINAVAAHLSFDPAVWQVAALEQTNSFCSLWLEASFDNTAGKIDLLCGLPNPGFSGIGLVGKIIFTAWPPAETTAVVFAPDGLALANDGQGTNILSHTEDFIWPAGSDLAENDLSK
ncbi:hypothetical protein COX69_00880 [Candidatus Falkowbacteria bacterium CG_4_10_14_0_2_um_filter_48_10]|uniref:Cohesin domain-containing protein n=1 Tax=Candidatus Falkowbacteria bacterium CG23_combo_of_CG06-09_8_20_14_all_49_15 TaxID=1974572 RepID=A0A2G9ZK89_9BACT|nr:MAG: hypothetical protein COX22_03750 [Candidatus Falkowbacteria bacterium CG23_combo_of_CG06-09_8_20_14_all_49_15]PJA08988.1 MAG: hypothetical protein COX69_00880 [Candidatus Falkowbacteria bacterium CG_4_10_14_0_2_um_filter_48_10]